MKISVICASLPTFNPGMVTVNQAFWSWFQRSGIQADVEQFQVGARYRIDDRNAPAELLGNLHSAVDADLILFWGDWLHMRNYHHSLAEALSRESNPAVGSASPADVASHLLLSKQPVEVLKRVGTVGQTLGLSSAHELVDTEYTQALTRLYDNAAFALMRDPVSCVRAELMRSNRLEGCLGCDCAFLLENDKAAPVAQLGDARKREVAVFFGRTRTNRARSRAFARKLASATGHVAKGLPWFVKAPLRVRAMRRIRQVAGTGQSMRTGDVGPETPPPDAVPNLLSAIRRSAYIVTDTYHLAVNAWNLGVPAVMVADTTEDVGFNVNSGHMWAWRDKRRELYSMLDALLLFVPATELTSRRIRARRLEHLARLLTQNPDLINVIHDRVDLLRTHVMTRLTSAVKGASGAEST